MATYRQPSVKVRGILVTHLNPVKPCCWPNEARASSETTLSEAPLPGWNGTHQMGTEAAFRKDKSAQNRARNGAFGGHGIATSAAGRRRPAGAFAREKWAGRAGPLCLRRHCRHAVFSPAASSRAG